MISEAAAMTSLPLRLKETLQNIPDSPGRVLVLGAAVLDRLFYVDKLPVAGETAMSDRMKILPGGKGANQALTARKMGAEVRFLSAVGEDEAADFVLQPLVDAGIDVSRVKRVRGVHTAETVISVDAKGENHVTSCPGAYHRLDPSYISSQREAFEWADYFLVQNELPRPTVLAAIQLAMELKKTIIFNPSPFRKNQPAPPEGINVMVPNELEAAGLLGVDAYEEIPVDERWRLWQTFGASYVVITKGSHGGEWFDQNGDRHEEPGRPVNAIDTVGAGDTFAGTLAALLSEGIDISHAIRIAHRAAELSVTVRGAQEGIPSRTQVANVL